jgi:hypothetical protein
MINTHIRKAGASLILGCALSAPVLAETCTDTTIPARNPDSVYTDNGDGTVLDTRTNLLWKRCAEGLVWDGATCSGSAQYFTWGDALSQAAASTYAGHSDWRLPNVKELMTLVEECRTLPAINPVIFPNAPSAPAWTSTPTYLVQDTSWYVDFSTGYSFYGQGRATLQAVMLVRGGNTGAGYGR